MPHFDTMCKNFNTNPKDIFRGIDDSITDQEVIVSPKDILKTLREMKPKSSPGPSGFSYLYLVALLPNTFAEMINILIKIGDLASKKEFCWITDRKIIFIPKKCQDRTLPSSFRPISLLETIFKLISKLFMNKLEKIVYNSVLPTQFGFIPGRQMSLASVSILTITRKLQETKTNGALLFIDIKAAFDCAKLSAIHRIIEYLLPNSNIPEIFRRFFRNGTAWIEVMNHRGRSIYLMQEVGHIVF